MKRKTRERAPQLETAPVNTSFNVEITVMVERGAGPAPDQGTVSPNHSQGRRPFLFM